MKSDRKTILHLIATNFYGGPEKQIIEHLKRLDHTRYRGVLASFLEGNRPNEIFEKASKLHLEHHGILMRHPLDFGALRRLLTLLRNQKTDLLCTHGYKATVMGWLAGLLAERPVIAFSRGYTGEDLRVSFYEWLERLVIGKTAGIVCVSIGQQRKLDSLGVQYQQAWVVHNAVSTSMLSIDPNSNLRRELLASLNLPEDARLVVSAGRLSPEKGHRFLVEAIAKVSLPSNGAYFIFCGDGPCKHDLALQAKALGVAEKCRFPGFRRDLDDIFEAMDFSVLPSLTEGLPNVVLESFAHAKPVVASAVGGVPELVIDGITGVLVQPAQPDPLSDAISGYLRYPDKARQMGRAGYEKVQTEFSFEVQSRKIERVYSSLLGLDPLR